MDRYPVHPHMRGEYKRTDDFTGERGGSSPHAWGILSSVPVRDCSTRFIPTCVGNTCSSGCRVSPHAVHPHMRGEYLPQRFQTLQRGGSSPHAWGIRGRAVSQGKRRRFIPTCVGNTFPPSHTSRAGAVHPHMRGEYGVLVGLGGGGLRFIPTCVGNTHPRR